jgi:energy-coupling factor transport system permease protein
MDSRGYGRSGDAPARVRRLTAALLLAGLLGLCLGTYGLLDTSTPRLIGAPMLLLGLALCAAGLALGGRRVQRTSYRPDQWAFAEWSTVLAGMVAAIATVVTGAQNASALNPSVYPLAWPTLAMPATLGILGAVMPAVLTPRPPITTATPARPPAAMRARQPAGANA